MNNRNAHPGTNVLSEVAHHLDATTEELRAVMPDVGPGHLQASVDAGEITPTQARLLSGHSRHESRRRITRRR
jgi:hypothetical protein